MPICILPPPPQKSWINIYYIFLFHPIQHVSITLTLQLFKPSFQDVGVLHLINKCCWGQTGLSVPVVPLHGHFSGSLP